MIRSIPFPDISPEIFTLRIGDFVLAPKWYAMAYIVGILVGWAIIAAAMRHPKLWPDDTAPMSPKSVEDLITAIVVGVILGGRLGYVLFYQPDYYLSHPLEILYVWQGGMSFHGGLLGVGAAALWFSMRRGVPWRSLFDALALGTPVGLFLGRIANFINAELWGAPTTLPWGVVFPGATAQDCPGITGPCARHPSQLYEAALEGLLLGIIIWVLGFALGKLKRPGFVAGIFLAGYALSRMLVETVRQADAQFVTPDNPAGNVLLGLSMGQLLSLPMLLLGLVLIVTARRQ
ncbi:prolipoprotein diacylglyceryl transferase [Palleronia caenipelagi]|uniref:Phosphatidylglycerol--prolipoprotein diacylglyceryl transferase n=1 Tax=Palleronia caenipelagi TaxID=2489174 RepID=A0A547Q9Q0_9RHOB|nr:prolipoprotein diacylglyceryl transferase [Palleronia caenipelagi]TRD23119.1 prolipoprotein diacylglyceryl transferase [Palleronia caenipelagi]